MERGPVRFRLMISIFGIQSRVARRLGGLGEQPLRRSGAGGERADDVLIRWGKGRVRGHAARAADGVGALGVEQDVSVHRIGWRWFGRGGRGLMPVRRWFDEPGWRGLEMR